MKLLESHNHCSSVSHGLTHPFSHSCQVLELLAHAGSPRMFQRFKRPDFSRVRAPGGALLTPCALCLYGWNEAEGTHPPSMYVKDPIFQAARDETVVLIGLVQWWRLQSSGRRMDRFAFGTCCQWTQCSCRNENKKERPAGSGFLIGTILLLALQPS